MSHPIRSKQEAVYFIGISLILFMLLGKLLPLIMPRSPWMVLIQAVLGCWPCAGFLLGRQFLQNRQPDLVSILGGIAMYLLGLPAGLPMLVLALIGLCRKQFAVDPLSRLRLHPLVTAVGVTLMITGLLDTLGF